MVPRKTWEAPVRVAQRMVLASPTTRVYLGHETDKRHLSEGRIKGFWANAGRACASAHYYKSRAALAYRNREETTVSVYCDQSGELLALASG